MKRLLQRNTHSSASRHPAGFTLLEVLFAIVTLAMSLVVLLGLQTSAVRKALRDRNQQQAMLLARSLLAAIENDPEAVKQGDITKSAYDMMRHFKLTDREQREEKEQLALFDVNLLVQRVEIPVPGMELPLPLNQIILTVYWGNRTDESLQVIYFVPLQQL